MVVDGRVSTGANAIAGEWGHNPLPWPRDDERPGPGLLLRPHRLHRDVPVRARAGARSRARDGRGAATRAAIAARADAGDAGAEATLARYEDRLARALASVINMLDPDVIVLGGGMSNIDALYANVPAPGRGTCSPTRAHASGAAAARRLQRRARRGLAVVRGLWWCGASIDD